MDPDKTSPRYLTVLLEVKEMLSRVTMLFNNLFLRCVRPRTIISVLSELSSKKIAGHPHLDIVKTG